MYDALEACSDLLYQFGGHVAAAGMTVQLDQVEAFAERFEQVVRDRIDPELLVPTVSYDLELKLKDIDWKWYRSLQRFAPFGPGNLEPVFMTAEVYLHALPRVVGNNHLKLQLKEEEAGEVFDAIAFSQGDQAEKLSMDQPFAICYQIEANTFNGRTTLQLNIKDLKPAT
jgi:single-stranded-DNA-specific exonuclease